MKIYLGAGRATIRLSDNEAWYTVTLVEHVRKVVGQI